MSTLRAEERGKQPVSEQTLALQAYLKRYTDTPLSGEGPKKKRRKKNAAFVPQGIKIVDEDATGFKTALEKKTTAKSKRDPYSEEQEEEEDLEDEPVIANPGEAELYARLRAKEKSGVAMQNWTSASEGYPIKRTRHDSPDASPPRRRRHDSPDASPPRRLKHDNPDASPPRRPKHDSLDASPPRRQRQDSSDASPPRRPRHDSPDASPPRRRGASSSLDTSPPRRQEAADRKGASPPRQKRGQGSSPTLPPSSDARKKARTLSDGTAAGMVSGEALTAQLEKKRAAERERFAKLEAASGSRHAATVYRDTETGRRMTKEEFEAAQKVAADKKKPVYEAPEWGGGIRQMKDRVEQAEAMRREASKPFARSLDDVDEEMQLRDRARFGDPMAHLVKQREAVPPPPSIPAHLAKQMKKSGFVIPQEVPSHSWLKRKMGPPPNRYGIRPGRHWDGVDRSTGFEREMFKQQATRAAQEREARMWSQADM